MNETILAWCLLVLVLCVAGFVERALNLRSIERRMNPKLPKPPRVPREFLTGEWGPDLDPPPPSRHP